MASAPRRGTTSRIKSMMFAGTADGSLMVYDCRPDAGPDGHAHERPRGLACAVTEVLRKFSRDRKAVGQMGAALGGQWRRAIHRLALGHQWYLPAPGLEPWLVRSGLSLWPFARVVRSGRPLNETSVRALPSRRSPLRRSALVALVAWVTLVAWVVLAWRSQEQKIIHFSN